MTDDETQKLLGAIQQQNAALASTMRQQFEISTEAFKHELRLVAQGVASLGERVSREIGRLDEKVDQGFANAQA